MFVWGGGGGGGSRQVISIACDRSFVSFYCIVCHGGRERVRSETLSMY
jgi:hypothetical protein